MVDPAKTRSRKESFFQGLGQLEITVGGRASGMDDALRDTLVVEVLDLLPKNEILQQ
jgi:hypothetical protein